MGGRPRSTEHPAAPRPDAQAWARVILGPILGYVVEGQMRFAINDERSRNKILPVGKTLFEPSGAVHTTSGSARPDGPTRALVFMLVPKGSPLTAPA